MARMADGAGTTEHDRAHGRAAGTAVVDSDAPVDGRERIPLAEPSLVIEVDDPEYAADPAGSIVPIGQVPAVRPPVGSRRRLIPPMPTDIARGWIVTAALTLIGGMLRFWQLGWRTDGGTPLFDEKYYAVQAAEVIRNSGFEDNPAYNLVVHPPLGKQLIAIGELIFGYNPTGWRFASAVFGAIGIGLAYHLGKRITGSTLIISGSCPASGPVNRCSIDLTVTIPFDESTAATSRAEDTYVTLLVTSSTVLPG